MVPAKACPYEAARYRPDTLLSKAGEDARITAADVLGPAF